MSETGEVPMDTAHPDEGTIHAWLDGELDAAKSARVASHVAACAECQAAVAEARGLIAGASRVVRALDDGAPAAPAGQPPVFGASARTAPAAGSSMWRMLRITPARAAIAATLLIVAGIALSRDWIAHEQIAPPVATRVASAPAATLANPVRDSLLDSAIHRNVAKAVPPRVLEAAPGPDVLAAKAPPAPAESVDLSAGERVAEGRMAARAMRMRAPVADHAVTGAVANAAPERAVAVMKSAPVTADQAQAAAAPAQALQGRVARVTLPGAGQCVRVEGGAADATWAGLTLPLVVALDAGTDTSDTSGMARILGAEEHAGTWRRTAGDSLYLTLRRDSRTLQLAGRGGTVASAGGMTGRVVGCP